MLLRENSRVKTNAFDILDKSASHDFNLPITCHPGYKGMTHVLICLNQQ